MPLHLLGKKSWNVYNQANIERVQRDEAEAAAREAVEEERQQENDAARRLAVLRGETPPPLLTDGASRDDDSAAQRQSEGHHSSSRQGESSHRHHQSHRKRRRHDEDDTDFEMRVARDHVESHRGDYSKQERCNTTDPQKQAERSDAPIVDHAGHINLFPEERDRAPGAREKNIREDNRKVSKTERKSAKQKQDLEDQYMMRFSNAAGKDASNDLAKGRGPWYAGRYDHDEHLSRSEAPRKDAFGRDDPDRESRDNQRIEANDPLAMMRRGAAKVREVETQRRAFNEERERELRELRREERRQEKRRRRHEEGRSGQKPADSPEFYPGHGFSRNRRSEGRHSLHHHKRARDHEDDRRDRHRSPRLHSDHNSRRSDTTTRRNS